MTRYARAKGSKSSNERLPNEPTPWHVMKQQLEENLKKEEEVPQRVKSARELLSENENTNNKWAEFEETKPRQIPNKPNIIFKQGKPDDKRSTGTKPADSNDISGTTVKHSTNNEMENKIQQDSTLQKRKIEDSTNVESKNYDSNKRSMKDVVQNTDTSSENKNENTQAEQSAQGKLSKRQKRNRKNIQKKLGADTNNSQSFNVTGNDWSNSVKFGEPEENNSNPNVERPTDTYNEQWQANNNRFNERRGKFSNNSNRFNGREPFRGQKVVKRKPAKIRDDKVHKRRKPDMAPTKMMINGVEVEIVSYDGFPVQKRDAEKLKDLKEQMIMKGIPKSEVDAAMKLERRKAEKALTRIKKTVCYHCRKSGHNLSDCPELANEESGTGICFKCGSTEHTHFECKVNKSTEYRYASCFICREQGHIAKQCPDNPKGIYPQGGACKICGDVTHLKKDCPDLAKEREQATVTVDKITGNTESLEDNTVVKEKPKECHNTKKIVKF